MFTKLILNATRIFHLTLRICNYKPQIEKVSKQIKELAQNTSKPDSIFQRYDEWATSLKSILGKKNYLDKETAIQHLEEISQENDGNYEAIVAKFRPTSSNISKDD